MTTLLIRKGLNGFPYSVCNQHGQFIANFNSLDEIHEYYKIEKHEKTVKLKKETSLYPISKPLS